MIRQSTGCLYGSCLITPDILSPCACSWELQDLGPLCLDRAYLSVYLEFIMFGHLHAFIFLGISREFCFVAQLVKGLDQEIQNSPAAHGGQLLSMGWTY